MGTHQTTQSIAKAIGGLPQTDITHVCNQQVHRQNGNDPERMCGLLLSIAKGKSLGQLGHCRYDWLMQVAIILINSNWVRLVSGWSELQIFQFWGRSEQVLGFVSIWLLPCAY